MMHWTWLILDTVVSIIVGMFIMISAATVDQVESWVGSGKSFVSGYWHRRSSYLEIKLRLKIIELEQENRDLRNSLAPSTLITSVSHEDKRA